MSTPKDNHEGKHNQSTLVPQTGASKDDEFIEKVAKRASEMVMDSIGGDITNLVLDEVYRDIGRSVVRKALWTIGVLVLVALGWIAAKFGFKASIG